MKMLPILLLGIILCSGVSTSQVPYVIAHHGYLTDSTGQPVTGSVSATFRIFIDSLGGTPVWSQSNSAVPVDKGVFGLLLNVTSLSFNTQYYLETEVNGDILAPRTRMTSSPYALRSDTANFAMNVRPSITVDSARIAGTVANFSITGMKIQEVSVPFTKMSQSGAANGQVMKWNGTTWAAANDSSGRDSVRIAGTVPVNSLTGANIQNLSIPLIKLDRSSALTGQVIKWNGSAWVSANDSVGGSGGGYLPLGGGQMTGAVTSLNDPSITMGKGNFGSGNLNPGTWAFVAGWNNRARGNWSTVGGGGGAIADSNAALGFAATVAGGAGNLAEGNYASCGGGYHDTAEGSYSAIAGGSQSRVTGSHSFIGGGGQNLVTADRSSIVGGFGNQVLASSSVISGGSDNIVTASVAFIGGGSQDTASGIGSFIGGGSRNRTLGSDAVVGGGVWNSAGGATSVIGGGRLNSTTDDYTTIAGGSSNSVTGSAGTIGGGMANTVGGMLSVVSGGKSNRADSSYAAVNGGLGNYATGVYATVAGGLYNTASGEISFAAGSRAKAVTRGSFVWADDWGTDFYSTMVNQFNVRATGGARIFSNSALTAGVLLPAGSSAWSSVSDSTKKQNIRPVNSGAILEGVRQLPVKQWSYRSQDPAIEHIGPMAQDFYRIFQIGESDTTISTIDPAGIALAAIQGLVRENDELRTINAGLERRLRKLEEAFESFTHRPVRTGPIDPGELK